MMSQIDSYDAITVLHATKQQNQRPTVYMWSIDVKFIMLYRFVGQFPHLMWEQNGFIKRTHITNVNVLFIGHDQCTDIKEMIWAV